MSKIIHKSSQLPKLMIPALLTALLFVSPTSQANDNQDDNNDDQANGKRRGPPPAAFTACESKNAGESAQFETRRGETLKGTCEVIGGKDAGKLVLRPDNMKRKGNNKRKGPPQEAFTACEGKNAGETAQFENRRGKTLAGTCEEMDGKLVLRPERFKK